ncbi:MAG: SRPBCC family protein [Caulobacter sp.]|nr:SRPBCC family protein [Caulobacter sp.]
MRGATLVFLALVMLASPPPARAREPKIPDGVTLEVQAEPGGRGGLVRAAVDIQAPPETVWRAILDCDRAGRMTPNVKRCTVVSRDADGLGEVREHVLRWGFLMPTLHSVARLDFQPYRRIAFRCLSGDIRNCQGEWRLEPVQGGHATHVTYENRATAPFGLPTGFATLAMRRDVPAALAALRRECEKPAP